jgi:hypothetical protein
MNLLAGESEQNSAYPCGRRKQAHCWICWLNISSLEAFI